MDGVHDCADGGLAVALAEMAIRGEVGCRVTGPDPGVLTPALAWFSESASRVVLSVAPERVAAVVDRARAAGVEAAELGEATGDRIVAEGGVRRRPRRRHPRLARRDPVAAGCGRPYSLRNFATLRAVRAMIVACGFTPGASGTSDASFTRRFS